MNVEDFKKMFPSLSWYVLKDNEVKYADKVINIENLEGKVVDVTLISNIIGGIKGEISMDENITTPQKSHSRYCLNKVLQRLGID